MPDRKLDLILLSIGANDINFSGLVADVIVDTPTERVLFRRSGVMGSVDDLRAALARDLPQGFSRLRDALKPLIGDLSRVVYASYANPTFDVRALPGAGSASALTSPLLRSMRSGNGWPTYPAMHTTDAQVLALLVGHARAALPLIA